MNKKWVPFLGVLCFLLLAANLVVLFLMNRKMEKMAAEPAVNLKHEAGQEETIGVQAGRAVGDMQVKAADSYKTVETQAEKTSKELEKTSQDAMKVLNEQAVKLSQDLQVSLQNFSEILNKELERFNETLKNRKTT